MIVRKVAEREDTQPGKSRGNDSRPASYEPKQGTIFLGTRPVEDKFLMIPGPGLMSQDGDFRNVVRFPKPPLAKSGLLITCFRDSDVKRATRRFNRTGGAVVDDAILGVRSQSGQEARLIVFDYSDWLKNSVRQLPWIEISP